MIKKLIFNGYEFGNESVSIISSDDDNGGKMEIQTFSYPYRGGEKIVSALNKRKTITIKGVIKKKTLGELNYEIQKIKKYVLKPKESTIYVYSDSIYGFEKKLTGKAICINGDNFIQRDYYNVNFCRYTLTFLIPAGYLEDINKSVITSTLTQKGSIGISYYGNYKGEINVFLTFLKANNISSVRAKIGNTELVTDNTIISDNDTIIIDSTGQNVFHNGRQLKFLGTFLETDKDDLLYLDFLKYDGNDASDFSVKVRVEFKNKYI